MPDPIPAFPPQLTALRDIPTLLPASLIGSTESPPAIGYPLNSG